MFYQCVSTPIGNFLLTATWDHLLSITTIKKDSPNGPKNNITKLCHKQLGEYFLGQRKIFNLPIKLNGTDFQRKVWLELKKIPYGETCSYADIAQRLDNSKAFRAVGSANKANPLPLIVPCHRVINSNGSIAGYALGVEAKSWLLNLEKTTNTTKLCL